MTHAGNLVVYLVRRVSPLNAKDFKTNNLLLWRHSGTVVHRPPSFNNLHLQLHSYLDSVIAKSGGFVLRIRVWFVVVWRFAVVQNSGQPR